MASESPRAAVDRLGAALAGLLAEVDLAVPGTVTERMRRCAYAGCRCRADPPQLHGPYWQWTRTVDGKTVTRNVSAAQAAELQTWIDDARRLRDALRALEDASTAAAEADRRS